MEKNPVYMPREDSKLLAKAVKKYAYGSVLDIGTGSGIQALTATRNKNVNSVIAADINPKAIKFAKNNNYHKKIKHIISNLFSDVSKSYDTIIFNPPYLPNDSRIKDLALDGGKKGYELSVKFLENSKIHLNYEGIILFLFSSLTKKNIIDKTLIENAYIFEEVENSTLKNKERLFVYKIKKLESFVKNVKNPRFFNKGKRGLIYIGILDDKNVGIKIRNPKSDVSGRLFIEGNNLKEVNLFGIGPKLVKKADDYIIYEFVEGIFLAEFLEKASKKDSIDAIKEIIKQMRILDLNKINKEEMSNPYKHILITKKKKVVLIDFERAKKTLKPHNITQFCQYLTTDKINDLLMQKNIIIKKKELFKYAKKYKENYYEKYYEKIISLLK